VENEDKKKSESELIEEELSQLSDAKDAFVAGDSIPAESSEVVSEGKPKADKVVPEKDDATVKVEENKEADGKKEKETTEKSTEAEPEKPTEVPAEDEKPDNVAFAKMRKSNKHLEEQLKELQSKIETVPTEKPADAPKRPPADMLFMHLVRAEGGELTEAEIAALGGTQEVIASNIDSIITEELNSQELLNIRNMAKSRSFGAHSDVILEKVTSYMPTILAREREADSVRQNQVHASQQIMETYKAELQKSADDFPALLEDNASKVIGDWEKEHIGDVDGLIVKGNGKLPKELAQYLMLHPYERSRIIASTIDATSSVIKEMTEKIKTLEDKLKLSDSPESGSPSGSIKSKEIKTSADIERELETLSSQLSE